VNVRPSFGSSVACAVSEMLPLPRMPTKLAATLAIVSRVRRFHFGQRYFFRGPVRTADLVRSLERHMLEHVSQPGNAGIFAIAANVHMGKEGEDGGLMPLADQNRQSVAQHLHGDPLFER